MTGLIFLNLDSLITDYESVCVCSDSQAYLHIFYIIFYKYRFHSAIMHPICIVCSAGFEFIILIYIG